MRKVFLTGTALSLFFALPAGAESLVINPYPSAAPAPATQAAPAPSAMTPPPQQVVGAPAMEGEGVVETKLGKVFVPTPGSAYFDPPGILPEAAPEPEPELVVVEEAVVEEAVVEPEPEEIIPAKPMQIYSRPEALPHTQPVAAPKPAPVRAAAAPAKPPPVMMPPPEEDLEMSFSDLQEHRALKIPPITEMPEALPSPEKAPEPIPAPMPPTEELAIPQAPPEPPAMPEPVMVEAPMAVPVDVMPEERPPVSRSVPWLRARKATPTEMQQLAAMPLPPEKWPQNIRKLQPVPSWGVSADGKAWQARKGADLREVLWGWSQATGTTLVWDTPNNFSVLADAQISGNYENAVKKLLDQHDDGQLRPLGKLYVNPQGAGRTLVVTSVSPDKGSRN